MNLSQLLQQYLVSFCNKLRILKIVCKVLSRCITSTYFQRLVFGDYTVIYFECWLSPSSKTQGCKHPCVSAVTLVSLPYYVAVHPIEGRLHVRQPHSSLYFCVSRGSPLCGGVTVQWLPRCGLPESLSVTGFGPTFPLSLPGVQLHTAVSQSPRDLVIIPKDIICAVYSPTGCFLNLKYFCFPSGKL